MPLHIPLKINTIYGTTRRARNHNGDALAEFLNRPASCLNSAMGEFYPKIYLFIKQHRKFGPSAGIEYH
ncbi:MAG: hypothetical protein B7Y22_02925 [Polynucleobacter sp. 16-46-70]|nr:MAG: hypothetical protein B7Y22_02925 [Polynucleobacter sp. 16-46-70]